MYFTRARHSLSSNSTATTSTRRTVRTVLLLSTNRSAGPLADVSLHQATSTATTVSESTPGDYYGLFTATDKAAEAQEEQKIKVLRKRVVEARISNLQDSQVLHAVRSSYASGDIEKAFDLLIAMSNAWEGLLLEYDPGVKLLGAENRKGVTCYLDSILFAMFSRLDSFEAMLYNNFEDQARNKLGMLLRLWVNLLRSGKLITMDITQLLQESLAECGWKEAGELHQQDASEAFTFITEKLELPLLTLKMDIYHTGREDVTDDHKFINERLLEVAIPSDPDDPERTIALEDCLEAYFNNRIEVKRHLERRTTINSIPSDPASQYPSEKSAAVHVESTETVEEANPQRPSSASGSITMSSLRQRASSIVQQRFIPDESGSSSPPAYEADSKRPSGRHRSGSIRKEVMMPAWQFFSLIPWYTNNAPRNDAQVAAHFSSKRPILGMCLKRYSFTENGKAIRLGTKVDIPTEIGLPHFISDDKMDEDGAIYGNFKLSLQSVVCHQGNSVDSGHYISLVKGTNALRDTANNSLSGGTQDSSHWMRFDDLASKRITLVDIKQALKDETPYLLFYRIVPIENDAGSMVNGEGLPKYAPSDAYDSGVSGLSIGSLKIQSSSDEMPAPSRPSFEITAAEDTRRGRSPTRAQRRASVTFSESASQGELAVPDQESSEASSRRESTNAKGDPQSRRNSQTGEKLSKSFARMTRRKSKEAVPMLAKTGEPDATIADVPAAFTGDDEKGKNNPRKEGKREKSKSRLSRVSNIAGRGKGANLDRECCVM